jgi:hypothetical protein
MTKTNSFAMFNLVPNFSVTSFPLQIAQNEPSASGYCPYSTSVRLVFHRTRFLSKRIIIPRRFFSFGKQVTAFSMTGERLADSVMPSIVRDIVNGKGWKD